MVEPRKFRKRILLVEDHYFTRERMSLLLGGAGYMVATAANGEEALRRLHEHGRFDLILLDLNMPVMDGWHFRDAQRRDGEISAIPVVVCSGADGQSESSPAVGAAGLLRKPVDTAELLQTIERCCT